MANSYFQTSAATLPSVAAFTAAPNSYATNPMGDIPLSTYLLRSYPFAQNLNQIGMVSYTTTFPTSASAGFYANFQTSGYDYAYQDGPPNLPERTYQHIDNRLFGLHRRTGLLGQNLLPLAA